MRLNELAEYCKSINIDCDKCEHQKKCQQMTYDLADISPYGLLEYVKENKDFD